MKEKFFIAFIVLVSALPPLSTDLPLPALPEIALVFGVNDLSTSMMLIVFFITFTIATLIWGPLSDKYGRRPTLLVGYIIYLIASFLCGMGNSIEQLILFRALQGLGGGCSMTIASAIVRDVYSGKKQESVLAVVQSMIMICPLIAPVFGALLQTFISWRGVFFTQAIMGLIVVIGTMFIKETIPEKLDVHVLGALARLLPVLKHGKFMVMVITFSLPFICGMAWVASSAYIYENFFELSSQMYSYFFALTAVGAIAGPISYIYLSRKFSRYNIVMFCFFEIIISGIAIIITGSASPLLLALMILPTTFCIGMIRPPLNYMMLNNKEGDSGSASALIGAASSLGGIIGMVIVFLFNDYILAIGLIYAVIGAISLYSWVTTFRYTKNEEAI